MIGRTLVILAISNVLAAMTCAQDRGADPAGARFFELHIRPLLADSCLKCHGADPSKIKGNLDLTTRSGMLRGGDDGPAIDLNHPADSLLLKMVNYVDADHQMPPKKKLPADKIALLTQWVAMGAPWTTDAKDSPAAVQVDPKNYWAYQTPKRPAIPTVAGNGWARNPIDAFLLAGLQANGLKPNGPADRVTLIRRATYDLIGLPPTQQEIAAFLNDQSPDAWEKVIDRLLASPHYGEKWGRHWLDLVGFAETNGYERDADKPNAWRYRDYVIRSFNQNKPYDRFIKEQLAGDEISPRTPDCIIATGYYRLGIWDDEPADNELARYDVLDGIVGTTSQVMLGMSMNCARCHNHKRDPIPQEDYYRLLAFFHHVTPMATNGSAVEMPVKYEPSVEPALQTALCVTESPEHIDTYVLGRGNPQNKTNLVTPGFPKVLGFADPVITPDAAAGTSGRRTALANWIASADNPLTARVMANRIWQYHFGRGIVPTPNDFGRLGELPTNQPLLDWLACEFSARHWDIKSMHKLMMMSSSYQMSSADEPTALAKDPTNNLFWRFNMRRLTAEEIRDSILFVDGTLNPQMGGPSVFPEMPPAVLATSSRPLEVWGLSSPLQAARRSIYVKVKRSLLYPLLFAYDAADTDASTAVRFSTTVPTQALTMLNSVFLNQQADIFATRLEKTDGLDVARQIQDALTAVTQHDPPAMDIARGEQFVHDMQQQEHMNQHDALKAFCLLSLNLNEFVYLD